MGFDIHLNLFQPIHQLIEPGNDGDVGFNVRPVPLY
jgi:hypothetical protein